MNEESIKELMLKSILTLDEVQLILDFIVDYVRSKLDINDYTTRLCKESSLEVAKICNKLNIAYIPFNMGELGMKDLEHHYGIIGFQTEFGQICILMDLTYIQFTEKEYLIKNESVLSPGNFISPENKALLVNKGYLTLTQENLCDYIRSFIETYKITNIVNEYSVYYKIYNILNNFHINLIEKDYLNSKGITY